MDEITGQVEKLASCIKNSEIYKNYRIQVEKIEKQPGLLEKINEFRQKNFELQSAPDSVEMLDKVEDFARQYEQFRENPLVEDFLQAELAVCRMMQDIQIRLTDAIDFV